ncbi:winged helix-turn-helix domain-containing protein [Lentzea alba]|uniref:AfsR/SARP family transcriptional regulator n=1 Tax=Lentzea alba TaxID=2714351 RepID=UPI0039BFB2C3
MRFGVLGTVVMWHEGREISLSSAHQRTVLAALLLQHNRVVPLEKLIDALWDSAPPPTARNIVQGCVSHLRTLLAPDPEIRIMHRLPGYVLETPAERLDLTAFRTLATDPEHLREALTLWRNDPLADVPGLHAQRAALNEERLGALERCLDHEIRAGAHREAIPELTALVRAHPLREGLHGLLMRALHRAGRGSEALQAFHDARRVLGDETGSEPGPELQTVFQQILQPACRILPRQLPAALPGFVDRRVDLGDGPVTVITGQRGLGKTALALHWGHRQVCPDGQLFADLTLRSSFESLHGMVSTLIDSPLPTDEHALAALYRSLLAGKRMVVVLDNAQCAEQVIPLLPGTPTCRVLITSRDRMDALAISHHATRVRLGPWSDSESRDLLVARLGPDLVRSEPRATAELIRFCAGNPRALATVASRVRPHLPRTAACRDAERWALRTVTIRTGRRSTPDLVGPASSTAQVPA